MTEDFTPALLTWFDHNRRDLPWRRKQTSPWGVLVSEFMLQQTPVARVIPTYLLWLERWPSPDALAAEPSGAAVRAWGKLGYPRRALRLHACAVEIVSRYGGIVPNDVDALLALPGIGAYTARAVVAFAFGQRAAVVDTNVRRVVTRLSHGRAAAGPPSSARDLGDVEMLLPAQPSSAARFSAALMELGAIICTARHPRCGECPLTGSCAWLAAGSPENAGPTPRPQQFYGTDRQVRGRLLDVLRRSMEPVERIALDVAWSEPVQRDRALGALLIDGLVQELADGRYALPS